MKKHDVCQKNGIWIDPLCLAGQVEVNRKRNRREFGAYQEELVGDPADSLSICLKEPERQRYEEVHGFRVQYGFSMWSEEWYEMIASNAGIVFDDWKKNT